MGLSSSKTTMIENLKATSGQIHTTVQNVAGANDPDYTHRTARTTGGSGGSVRTFVRRDASPPLLVGYLSASTRASTSGRFAEGVEKISCIYGGSDFANSPARRLGALRDALRDYHNQYDQPAMGEAVIARAKDFILCLQDGAETAESLRQQIDEEIEESVRHIDELLARIEDLEKKIASATQDDAMSLKDRLDGALKELSQEIGITVSGYPDGPLAIYGNDGSTLYNRVRRRITFFSGSATVTGDAGVAVSVDNVPLSHTSFRDPNGRGRLGALLELRNEIVPQFQKQLDEIAAAVKDMFKGPPPLFVDGGDASVAGLAFRLSVNPDLDKAGGGSPSGLGGREKIQEMFKSFDKKQVYGKGTLIEGEKTVLDFAQDSTSWIENIHKVARSSARSDSAKFQYVKENFSNKTGVNVDIQMTNMLNLEQAYNTGAYIMNVISRLFQVIIDLK